jgi:hypothetical protein
VTDVNYRIRWKISASSLVGTWGQPPKTNKKIAIIYQGLRIGLFGKVQSTLPVMPKGKNSD